MPEVKVVNKKEDFKAEAELGNVVVWNGEDRIYSILENLQLADSIKYKLKACYEVKYKEGITFSGSNGRFEANRLSELLKRNLEFKKNDRVIIKSNDISEVLATIQQLIYLNLILDTHTDEEVLKKSLVDKFYEKAGDIRNAVVDFQQEIKNYKTGIKAIVDRKNSLEKLTKEILQKIDASFEKTIKVAVFATKKTGKSMIVNGLLGEEYAPTSLELATPNVIEYIPYDGEKIILEDKDKIKTFNSPNEIREYINKLFKEVNIAGDKLPVMKVKYPRRRGINYEIYDTPGPDLAGSKHHEFIDEYIEKSDVIIFAIDYSKYAQSSEVELLEKIKDYFEKKDKAYSLICVLNKIDLMFQDPNTEKNKIRATDFIHNKMKTLGFRNFIVLPLSALIYFYSEKVLDVYKNHTKQDVNKDDFYNKLFDFKKNFRGEFTDEEKTYVNNVINILENLIDHFGIKDPTYYDIVNWSGFPYLLEYINYVVENKAALEKAWSILDFIESKVTEIENDIATKKILQREIEELKSYLDDFLREAEEEYAKEEIDLAFEKIKKDFREFFTKSAPENVYNTMNYQIIESFKNIKRKIKISLDIFIKQHGIPDKNSISFIDRINPFEGFNEDEMDEIISDFEREFGGGVIDEETIELLIESIQEEIENYMKVYLGSIREKLGELEQDLIKRKERIKRNIIELNNKLKRKYNFEVELKLPTLDTDIDLIIAELNRAIEEIQHKLSDLIGEKFDTTDILKFTKYKSLFVLDRYKIGADSIRKGVKSSLSDFEKQINYTLKEIKHELNHKIFNPYNLDFFFKSVDETKEGYIAGLEAIISPVKRIYSELNLERSTKEEILNFLSFVETQYKEISGYFKEFREEIEKIRDKE